jgi:phosphoribosylformylglycinamidine synthase
MDLDFLTAGPVYCRPCEEKIPASSALENYPEIVERYDDMVLSLLSSLNNCSKDWVIRQYDHEVRGSTVLKPLHGIPGHSTHGDAAVLKPVEGSMRGLAAAVSSQPWAVALDPHKGGMLIVDEICRNLVAVGARPHSITDCLNFGSPEKPEVLGLFKESVRGMGESAAYLGIPIPSGNVSFYNESHSGTVLPTPVALGCGIVDDIGKCITSDFKERGSSIYVIGKVQDAMAGSQYFRDTGSTSSKVPSVDLGNLKSSIDFMLGLISGGKLLSCHDISDGGLAVALCEMSIGGSIGAEVDLSALGQSLRSDVKLFSESPTRWIVEVPAGKEIKAPPDIEVTKIGTVGGENVMIYEDEEILFDRSVADIEEKWARKLWEIMG